MGTWLRVLHIEVSGTPLLWKPWGPGYQCSHQVWQSEGNILVDQLQCSRSVGAAQKNFTLFFFTFRKRSRCFSALQKN